MLKARDMTQIALFAALIAICAWLSIPATVPFTLQAFAVFLAAGVLGGKNGTLAVLVYLLLGAAGLPVFSGFRGGIGVLLGATGGYLIGFIGTALVMWGVSRLAGDGAIALLLGMAAGLLVCYAFGTAWFLLVYLRTTGPVTLAAVLTWCVFPFIVPDIGKMLLAFLLIRRLKPRLSAPEAS